MFFFFFLVNSGYTKSVKVVHNHIIPFSFLFLLGLFIII